MKKMNNTRSRNLNQAQLQAAGGGYWGCDVFGGAAGGLAGLGAAAAVPGPWSPVAAVGATSIVGPTATAACNYAVDNWGSWAGSGSSSFGFGDMP